MPGVTNDRRQAILNQLDALLGATTITLSNGVIPAGNYVHNRNELPAEKVPGIILLDADEVHDPTKLPPAPGRQLNKMQMQIMKMTPEIYVVLDTRAKFQSEDIGSDLNLARLAILAVIIGDLTLQGIIGPNGVLTYDGCVTDLVRNRTMRGQLGLSFSFGYPLLPAEVIGR